MAEAGSAGLIDVLTVTVPQALLLDVAGPAEAFRMANQQLIQAGAEPRFRLRYVGPQVSTVSSVGLMLTGLEPLPTQLERPTWLVLVGRPSAALLVPPDATMRATLRWLSEQARPWLQGGAGHRLVCICSGSLLAAQAGLIGTRRCTTHHEHLDRLRDLAPDAQVIDNRVFVLDGALASSAGVTAGIDLALHLIAGECGDEVAAMVAKNMVVYLRRSPNDPELSPMLAHRHHLHPALHRAQDAVCERPNERWTLDGLADAAHVTVRHLQRLFADHALVSPMVYVEKIRLERARQALVRGASVTQAADRAGFASDLQLRRAWSRHFSGTPRAARQDPRKSGMS